MNYLTGFCPDGPACTLAQYAPHSLLHTSLPPSHTYTRTPLCSPRFEIPMSDEVLPPNQQPERGIANLKCNKYVRDGAT